MYNTEVPTDDLRCVPLATALMLGLLLKLDTYILGPQSVRRSAILHQIVMQ